MDTTTVPQSTHSKRHTQILWVPFATLAHTRRAVLPRHPLHLGHKACTTFCGPWPVGSACSQVARGSLSRWPSATTPPPPSTGCSAVVTLLWQRAMPEVLPPRSFSLSLRCDCIDPCSLSLTWNTFTSLFIIFNLELMFLYLSCITVTCCLARYVHASNQPTRVACVVCRWPWRDGRHQRVSPLVVGRDIVVPRLRWVVCCARHEQQGRPCRM